MIPHIVSQVIRSVLDTFARPALRKAAENFGWLFVERVGRFALGALVGLVVARHLGPTRLGSLSYCAALVALLGFVPSLGIDATLKRDLISSPQRSRELMASGFVLRGIAGTMSCVLVWIMAAIGYGLSSNEARIVAVLALSLLQPAIMLPELWLQAHLRARSTTAAQLGSLAAMGAVRIWLVWTDATLTAFAWAMVGEAVLSAAGVFAGAHFAGMRMPLSSARIATMRALLKESWPLMFASLAIVVYMKIDEVMLRQLAGPAEVGLYSAAVRLSEVWYFLPMALSSSLLPALIRARQLGAVEYARRQQQYYDVSAALAYALSVPVALVAPFIVKMAYGSEFAAAGPMLSVHIWSSIFVFLGVARGQWLVNEGLQKFYLAATCLGAIVNVAFNLILIPRWGGLGAAWATVVAYGLAAWLASYFHAAVRPTARMQTLALLIPFRGLRSLKRA